MRIKIKTIIFIVSLAFNGLFFAILLLFSASKSNLSSFYFPAVEDGYTAAAAISVLPASSSLIFNPIEIDLKPAQKAFIQYSAIVARKQTNISVNALYDPQIISVEYTGSGISITALSEGETLMQYISNSGFKDLVRITVTK
jgi:hypothetical protein